MKRVNFSWKYAIIITGVVVLAYLVMAFNARVVNLRHLSAQKDRVSAQKENVEATISGLETQIAHATSDAAVVEWAYGDGNMVREGDHPVVPLAAVKSTPVPTPTPLVTQRTASNWEMWWWLFIDPSASKSSP
jgi:hypothetical protein